MERPEKCEHPSEFCSTEADLENSGWNSAIECYDKWLEWVMEPLKELKLAIKTVGFNNLDLDESEKLIKQTLERYNKKGE